MTPGNLVLCGMGSDSYMCGNSIPWRDVDFELLNESRVRLERNGVTILEAPLYNSLGGVEQSVSWCVSEARVRGLAITQNALLITGVCGRSIPFEVGKYIADFGPLGAVNFEIENPDNPVILSAPRHRSASS